jgi:hypothetical protein
MDTYNFIYYYTITTIIYVHARGQIAWACKGANGMSIFKAKHNLIVQGTHIIPFIITQ